MEDKLPGEEQINVNAIEAEFEDRDAGRRHGTDVCHLVGKSEHLWIRLEVIRKQAQRLMSALRAISREDVVT